MIEQCREIQSTEKEEAGETFTLYQTELRITAEDLAKVILDVGSANAAFETDAKKLNPDAKIVSVDSRYHPNVGVVADWKKLPFKPNTFDLTLSRAAVSIFETESWIPMVKEALRVTKNGGEVRIARIFKSSERWKELEDYLRELEKNNELAKELVSLGQFPTETDENTGEALKSEEGYLLVIHKTRKEN